MKIGYLINQYPKVSHTFIRREIEALEALGAEVTRFSVRATREALVDRDDNDEAARTRVLLRARVALLGALASSLVLRPLRFARAVALMVRIGWRSERGLLRHLAYLVEACLLRRWAQQAGCAHLHAHFGTNPAAVAMLCHELGGPPYSFTVHGPEEFDKPRWIGLSEKIARARFVVAISSFGRGQLYRQCPQSQWSKVRVVHCGVTAAFLEAEPTAPPDAPRLVCVGRLCEQKGQRLLVEAAARLAQEGVDFELTLVGDGELRGEVEALVDRHGLGARVRITGWASGDEVRTHLRRSRALVLPSFAEGLPVVIMEALALGRPVLSTYVAGIPELVEAGACGWLVPAGSIDALVAGLRDVLSASPDELRILGAEGARRVRVAHDARKEAGKLLAAIHPCPPGTSGSATAS